MGYHIYLVGAAEIYKSQNDTTDIDPNIVDHLFLIKHRPLKVKTSSAYWKHKISKYYKKIKMKNKGPSKGWDSNP